MDDVLNLAALKHLLTPATAPYHERAVTHALHAWLAQLQLPVRCDAFGNSWVHIRRGQPKRRVALMAHLDHPALMVTRVSARRIHCVPQGNMPTRGLVGAAVTLPRSAARGVITRATTRRYAGIEHLLELTVQLQRGSAASPAPGDVVVFDMAACVRRGSRLHVRVADDLLGCAAIVGALHDVARSQCAVDVCGIFTRAEEVGLHGALAIADAGLLELDRTLLSVECSTASGNVTLGKGPVVRLGDRAGPFSPAACALVRGAAVALNAPFQQSTMLGGTCEASAFVAFGYQAGGVAMPLEAYHNAGARGVEPEQVDLRDLQGTRALLRAVAWRAGDGVDDMARWRADMLLSSEMGRMRLKETAEGFEG